MVAFYTRPLTGSHNAPATPWMSKRRRLLQIYTNDPDFEAKVTHPPSSLSVNLRWAGIAYVCAVLGLAVLGVGENFYPTAQYADAVEPWAWGHAIFCGLLTLGAGLLPDLKTGQRPVYLNFLISAPVMVYAGYASAAWGVPHLAHLVSERPVGRSAFVIDAFTPRQGSCRNGIEISSRFHVPGKVCGLSQPFLDRLAVGHTIVLIGPKSAWGIALESIERTD